ncbi:P-loop containing nucleoside triphosphate hydrolase protein [Lobosporangium transversale]|uniref:p-loop containing nucleoside triphosphate hydrolase protein n=1 Tax=Lobosporangium transversale TaxID=64571 RepID=A0A1Y2GXP9_9FUNG|nr:P-loop containing nucleoside triphosphate hydrolase protein [Lobosporangium transversale]ORZ26253.1 P-loop containing nucleoside triphosphate hydrolase protein [Lobosporangium transversale]|eukprot:XP_021884018.1 P-loop containing nucleoside triphosphate hydrolase protein [Lobosporangium transversale]
MNPLKVRNAFAYDKIINWFPGHMAKGLRLITEKLNAVQVVIEVRDARIPISSINHKFEPIAQRKDRLIVYNKTDLAHPATEQAVVKAFKQYKRQEVVFTNANEDLNIKRIISYLAKKAKATGTAAEKELTTTVMVVGMPNVGKSSLINSLRRIGIKKGKAAPTGAIPGITRTVAGTIKVLDSPKIYLIDTPGVMIPHIADPISAIKVALTGAISDHLSDEEVIADYLLFQLNQAQDYSYMKLYNIQEPTDDIKVFLPQVAKYIGALKRGGEYNLAAAAQFLIKQYRLGKLGRYTLDDIRPEALERSLTEESLDPISRRQQKKADKIEERKQKRLEIQRRIAEREKANLEDNM